MPLRSPYCEWAHIIIKLKENEPPRPYVYELMAVSCDTRSGLQFAKSILEEIGNE